MSLLRMSGLMSYSVSHSPQKGFWAPTVMAEEGGSGRMLTQDAGGPMLQTLHYKKGLPILTTRGDLDFCEPSSPLGTFSTIPPEELAAWGVSGRGSLGSKPHA